MKGVLRVDVSTVRAWIAQATTDVEEHRDELTRLDSAIGDADHGINLVRGFTAVSATLSEQQPATPGELLTLVGNTLISKVGGASGPLYGTAFRRAGKSLGGAVEVGPESLGSALEAALEGVQSLGAAAEGEKTMVDALAPAVRAYARALASGATIVGAAEAAAAAAQQGAEATIPMQALKGRASYLGPRSVGHQLAAAFEAVAVRLDRLAASHRRDGAPTYADILSTEALIARDPTFAADALAVLAEMGDGSAVEAVRLVAEQHAAAMETLTSPVLRERGADIRQIGRMVSDHLAGRVPPLPPAGQVVLVAEEVTAPDLLEYADRLVGAASQRGGANSHASIVARSLGVPLVAGLPSEVIEVQEGVDVLVDGDSGRVVLAPDAETTSRLPTQGKPLTGQRSQARAVTRDGVDMTLLANIASSVEARRTLDAGASGVGLLRTELPFLGAGHWPTQAEHEEALAPVLEVLGQRPVTVRLLDFSNDKIPAFPHRSAMATETALLLSFPDALAQQLRALAGAASGRDLRIMLPMVTSPQELEQVREALSGAVASVGGGRVPRLHPGLAANPQVLRLVERVAQVATDSGLPLSVCGDAAADPHVLPLFVGAGIRTISVAPSRLDAVRGAIRELSRAECQERLRAVLEVDVEDLVSPAGVPDA